MSSVLAEEMEATTQFGVGEPPLELRRINWGAVFFGWLWALVYGFWPWAVLLAGLSMASTLFTNISAGSPVRMALGGEMTIAVVSSLISWGLAAVLGVKGNRLMWENQQQRLAGTPKVALGRPSANIDEYLASQRTWGIVGALMSVAGFMLGVGPALAHWDESSAGWAAGSGIGVVVLLGLFIWDRARQRSALRVGATASTDGGSPTS
ncbi:MAG: hypothetical protein Q7V53_05905 [Caldisericota bacterium]|nr:hypothetical protein [Caldisericota bacterium]